MSTGQTPAAALRPAALRRVGLAFALVIAVLDQGIKLWLLFGYRLGERGVVPVLPGFDLVLVWNYGVSYGLFPQQNAEGQWLLVAVKVLAVVLLSAWLWRTASRAMALALGAVIGGAIGNGIDRVAYGAVADFVSLYIETATWMFRWYVFNLADVAIVVGVAVLVLLSFRGEAATKAP
jgi:signal peptidase II